MTYQLIAKVVKGDIDAACKFCNERRIALYVFQLRPMDADTFIIFRCPAEYGPALRALLGITPIENPDYVETHGF